MLTSLVFADKAMDKVSNEELGADVHNVPADGDCMLHAWIKATESNEELPLGFRMVTGLREGLAQYFESHTSALEAYHNKFGVWPWFRPDEKWINYDSTPSSVAAYAKFLRTSKHYHRVAKPPELQPSGGRFWQRTAAPERAHCVVPTAW